MRDEVDGVKELLVKDVIADLLLFDEVHWEETFIPEHNFKSLPEFLIHFTVNDKKRLFLPFIQNSSLRQRNRKMKPRPRPIVSS